MLIVDLTHRSLLEGMGGTAGIVAECVLLPIRFFGGAAISPSRTACLRASLRLGGEGGYLSPL